MQLIDGGLRSTDSCSLTAHKVYYTTVVCCDLVTMSGHKDDEITSPGEVASNKHCNLTQVHRKTIAMQMLAALNCKVLWTLLFATPRINGGNAYEHAL